MRLSFHPFPTCTARIALLIFSVAITSCNTSSKNGHSDRSPSSTASLDSFFKANSVTQENYKNYQRIYKPLIAIAAQSTFLSEDGGFGSSSTLFQDAATTFLSCAYWQESRFDPNARSYVGAQGIAQLMGRGAQGEISNILRERSRPARTWIQHLRRDLANNDWKYYWNNLNQSRKISQNSINPLLPEEAIIAGAVYYRYLFIQLKSFSRERNFCSGSLQDFFLMAAASYNGGFGLGSSLAAQYIKNPHAQSFREEAIGEIGNPNEASCDNSAMLKKATKLNRIPVETLKYICNISRCMDAGNIKEHLGCPVQ